MTQNARNQASLVSSHSCLASMPAASAGSPLCGPLERLKCRGLVYHADMQSTQRKAFAQETARSRQCPPSAASFRGFERIHRKNNTKPSLDRINRMFGFNISKHNDPDDPACPVECEARKTRRKEVEKQVYLVFHLQTPCRF